MLFFFFAIPFFIYLFYYLAKKDDAIYLDIETQPKGEELKKEIKEFNSRPWYKKHPVASVFLVLLGLGLVSSAIFSSVDVETPNATQSDAREIKQVFDISI